MIQCGLGGGDLALLQGVIHLSESFPGFFLKVETEVLVRRKQTDCVWIQDASTLNYSKRQGIPNREAWGKLPPSSRQPDNHIKGMVKEKRGIGN